MLAWHARADRGLDRLDLVNVCDMVAIVSADPEHAVHLEEDAGAGGSSARRHEFSEKAMPGRTRALQAVVFQPISD